MNKNVIAAARRHAMLSDVLGEEINTLLRDESTQDVLLNADGRLYANKWASGRKFTGHVIPPDRAETILRLVAYENHRTITQKSPILDKARLPTGERIAGTIYPVTKAPTFAIRAPMRGELPNFDIFNGTGNVKKAGRREELPCKVDDPNFILWAARNRKNVIFAGATGSGKTLAMNIMMKEMRHERVIGIDDSEELRISADDHVCFQSVENTVDMNDLLALSLRYKPDRIVVSELRFEASTLTFLASTNTGHRGVAATIHADSAEEVANRFDSICRGKASASEIRSAIDVIAFMRDGCVTNILDTKSTPYAVAAE